MCSGNRSSESGQILLAAVALLPLLLTVALYVYHHGIVGANRMDLENIADAAAMVGAIEQARHFNAVAEVNRRIMKAIEEVPKSYKWPLGCWQCSKWNLPLQIQRDWQELQEEIETLARQQDQVISQASQACSTAVLDYIESVNKQRGYDSNPVVIDSLSSFYFSNIGYNRLDTFYTVVYWYTKANGAKCDCCRPKYCGPASLELPGAMIYHFDNENEPVVRVSLRHEITDDIALRFFGIRNRQIKFRDIVACATSRARVSGQEGTFFNYGWNYKANSFKAALINVAQEKQS